MSRVVVKIGTSSITDDEGAVNRATIAKLCREVAALRADGSDVVIVTSGAIAAGLPELGLGGANRPSDAVTLQAVATVGQLALMEVYRAELASHGLVSGQVLLTPHDFIVRAQYLHARQTLTCLLELGVVPVVNENDAIADDEIRWGDNDRIAALVANLVDADRLVLLTDTEEYSPATARRTRSVADRGDSRDRFPDRGDGRRGRNRAGSGGMASKLAAAKIASWSGVDTVIANAAREDVVADAVAGAPGVGTTVRSRETRIAARKRIAFAVVAQGRVVVDTGARRALETESRCSPPAFAAWTASSTRVRPSRWSTPKARCSQRAWPATAVLRSDALRDSAVMYCRLVRRRW